MRADRRAAAVALLGAGAVAAAITGYEVAPADADTSLPVADDYGQSPAEVALEVKAAVAATPSVISATSTVYVRYRTFVSRVAAEKSARAAYLSALASHDTSLISSTDKTYLAARAARISAQNALSAARATLATVTGTATAAIRARHYLPVDGVWPGAVVQYFIPSIGLEPIQVRISVYGGHVSDITVPQYAATGDSAPYNARALPILMQEAMAAHDRATVAVVSGASLTSEAFAKSLQSALTKAGFKA